MSNGNIHQLASSWNVEHGDYSPARFYVTSGEAGSQVRTKLPDSMLGEISAMVQSGKLPDYRTAQDVIRDAVFHRLHFLRDLVQSGALDKTLTAYAGQSRLDSLRRKTEDEKRYVLSAREGLEEAIKNRDDQAGDEWIEAIQEQLHSNRDMTPMGRAELTRLVATYTGETP